MSQIRNRDAEKSPAARKPGVITWWISGLLINVLSWQLNMEMRRSGKKYRD